MDISAFENKWKNNLDNEIYDYVIQYINNVNANVWNNKILLLIGSGYNGKTTLCNDMNKLCNNAIQIFDGKINNTNKDIIMEEFERTQTNTIVTALTIDAIDFSFLQKVIIINMSKTVNNFQ
jgi:ABC-type phosphate transport system ATPase subunit